jgi:anthranilate phosphoribosyltransferase
MSAERGPASFGELFPHFLRASKVDAAHVRAAFDAILEGEWTPVQVGAFAVALRLHGESAEMIVAGAQAMRQAMACVEHEHAVVLDTCGTGGDGAHTLNLSTAAAIVVAAAGVHVAKHGNRSVSSRCGSADVIEALGIPIDVPPERQSLVLREARIAFLFAPAHHPALRHAAQARRELGVRTIFNALGPLANPARASHQLVGVYDDGLRMVFADALGRLGVKRAWVVRGEDGLDEVSPTAPTRVSVLDDRGVHERTVTPADFGLHPTEKKDFAGADARANAMAILAVFGGGPHPAREAVLLNAAAALAVATGDELRACTERARRALDDGAAAATLEAWKLAAAKGRTP